MRRREAGVKRFGAQLAGVLLPPLRRHHRHRAESTDVPIVECPAVGELQRQRGVAPLAIGEPSVVDQQSPGEARLDHQQLAAGQRTDDQLGAAPAAHDGGPFESRLEQLGRALAQHVGPVHADVDDPRAGQCAVQIPRDGLSLGESGTALELAPADIVAEVAPRELDRGRRARALGLRRGERRRHGSHREDAPGRRGQRAIRPARCAGMEDERCAPIGGQRDDIAASRGVGISRRCHHGGDGRRVAEAEWCASRQPIASRHRVQRLEQVALHQRQQRLRFRIAEARIELHHPRPLPREHQPSEQESRERAAGIAQGRERGLEDLASSAGHELGAAERDRCIRAHASRVGSDVASQETLVVLRRNERQRTGAIGDREEGELLTLHELLDQDLGARLAERVLLQHRIDGPIRLGERRADDHPLSGSQARGLDDYRSAELTRRALGVGGRRVCHRAGRRHARPQHELLGERLGGLDLGGLRVGTENDELRGAKRIYDPGGEGRLGTHDREVDPFLARQLHQRHDIGRGDRYAASERGDPRISRGRQQLEIGVVAVQLPGEGVLTAAAADEQYPHQLPVTCLACGRRC